MTAYTEPLETSEQSPSNFKLQCRRFAAALRCWSTQSRDGLKRCFQTLVGKKKQTGEAEYEPLAGSDRYVVAKTPYSTHVGGYFFEGVDNQTGESITLQRFDMRKTKFESYRDFKYRYHLWYQFQKMGQGHPHVLQSKGYYSDDQQKNYYLIHESMKGWMTLQQYFRRIKKALYRKYNARNPNARNRERFSLEIIRQVVSAVGYYHLQLVSHRQLTHHQIWLNIADYQNEHGVSPFDVNHEHWTAPRVKISGFQMSTPFYENDRKRMFLSRRAPEFMRPLEMLQLDSTLGFPVDIWQIGMLAYFLAVGFYPFEAYRSSVRAYEFCVHHDCAEVPIWGSDRFFQFIGICLEKDQFSRANINEVAGHPWLNSITEWVPNKQMGIKIRWRSEPDHFCRVIRMYPQLDFYIPLRRFFRIHHPFQLRWDVLEELRQGYYGWVNINDEDESEVAYMVEGICEALFDIPSTQDNETVNQIINNEYEDVPLYKPKLMDLNVPSNCTYPTSQEVFYHNISRQMFKPEVALYYYVYETMYGSVHDLPDEPMETSTVAAVQPVDLTTESRRSSNTLDASSQPRGSIDSQATSSTTDQDDAAAIKAALMNGKIKVPQPCPSTAELPGITC